MRRRTYQYGDQGLEATFAGIIRDKDWEKRFDQHRVFLKWEEVVDSETAACSRPLKVVNDVLWIEVENSAWAQQLQFKKLQLLDDLNDFLRISYYADIKFTVGKIARTVEKKGPKRPRMVPPPAEDIEKFEKQIDFIGDEDIKEAMIRLWYVSHAVRRD